MSNLHDAVATTAPAPMPTLSATPTASPPPGSAGVAAAEPARRFDAPDLVRGVIMAVMLLDHVRDFAHWSTIKFDPTDLAQTSAPLFLTRWITHFCAPLFVFLAGMAVSFQAQRGKTAPELTSFLLKRGVWLILLELVVIRALMFWQPASPVFLLQVIWTLGLAMICLALLVRLPRAVVLTVALALVFGHNLLDGIQVTAWTGPTDPVPTPWDRIWLLLHQVGAFPIMGWPSPVVFVQYPVLPWIGVMALGWLLGPVYSRPVQRRRTVLIALGSALTVAFVVLRLINRYGDPAPWSTQPTATFTILSFLNVTKYPASLDFLLMTIGPGLIALGLLERGTSVLRHGVAGAFVTLGRVPLLFYLLQWVYAKTASFVLAVIAGRDTTLFFQYPPEMQWNERVGFSLWVVYAIWIVGVVFLYLPCRWFAQVKARRRDWWLSYL